MGVLLAFAKTQSDAKAPNLIEFGGHAITEQEHAGAGRTWALSG